jgi:hypothetical protein
MSKKISGVVALVGLCALSLFLLNCGSSSSRPSGILYVLTQGANDVGNNVSSFAIDLSNGTLSLINSNASTCPAGNNVNTNPCGIPLDIVLDPTGATAFVLDQGVPCVQQPAPQPCLPGSANPAPPSIYPYRVNSDGSLSNPGTAVTWTANGYSDTALAMVRDTTGQFLFVIDEGAYPWPGYPTPSKTNLSCPHAPSPTDQTDVCPSISVFAMKPGSTTLTLQSGSPFYLSKVPSALSAVVFTPPNGSAQELLFVTNNLDICTQNCIPPSPNNDQTVSVYSVSSSGVLSELTPNSPYTVAAADPISVLAVYTNQTTLGENIGGLFVYVGSQNPGGGNLYPFQVCTEINAVCTQQQVASSLMVPLATCPLLACQLPPTPAGQSPIGMQVDPTNSFLYVVAEGSNQVFGFNINATSGKLTALTPANQPTGTQPVSIALHPSINAQGLNLSNNNTGQFLYMSNTSSNNITGFTLNTSTGSMSGATTTISPGVPTGIAVH